MQAELQSSFQRVEQALQRLTDSIAAYNPDVRAAEELEAADAAITEDLKKLVRHQRNHLRKEELRRQTDTYDAEIKSKIRNISDTRKELASIPAYKSGDVPTREIAVDELLRYAKYIARTSVPPTLPVQVEAVKNEPAQLTNGTSTPPPTDTQMQETNGLGMAKEPGRETMEQQLKYVYNKPMRDWISTQTHFEPWPQWPTYQDGALGAIQRMVEAGVDPASVLSKEAQAEAERKRGEEEEEERARLEYEERQRKWAEQGGGRRREREREVEEEVFNPDDI